MTGTQSQATVKQEDWRCGASSRPGCGGREFARIDIQMIDGSFAPGPRVRCVNCKRDDFLPVPTPPETGSLAELRSALEWYEEQVADGGKRARTALASIREGDAG